MDHKFLIAYLLGAAFALVAVKIARYCEEDSIDRWPKED